MFRPESFLINDLVDYLAKFYKVTVITRTPTYPKGEVLGGYLNTFKTYSEKGITVKRYPILLRYNERKINKILNVLWQPFAVFYWFLRTRFDSVFVFQSGSIYSYSFLFPLRFKRCQSVLWSQDLWPEAGYEYGVPKLKVVDFLLTAVTKFTLKNFKTILSQNKDFQSYYDLRYKVKSEVIHNFTKVKKTSTYPDREDARRLVYAGNIGTMQNLEKIVQFYFGIRKFSDVVTVFDIYGEGSLFGKMRDKYDGMQGIKFHGRVDRKVIDRELPKCRYAIFSLIKGPVAYTLPGRLQFLYNSNIPIIYLGGGAPKKFIEDNNAGLVIDEGADPIEVLERMHEFEAKVFNTEDVFNETEILGLIKEVLEDKK